MNMTPVTIAQACERLLAQDDILIITHRRPDGDTLGSGGALCRLLQHKGKRAFLHPNEDATPRLAPLMEGLTPPEGFSPRMLVAVDTASEELFPASAEPFRGRVDLCVDHHPSNTGYARETLVEPQAAATGEVIWKMAVHMGVKPDLDMCRALYIAVSTDTGCFRFSNTTPLAHRIAADCMEAGLDAHAVNQVFFERKTKTRFRVERQLFDTLRFYRGGKLVCGCLERDFTDSIGASGDDLDNLSTLLMHLEGVECAVFLQELKHRGEYKVSLRTNKPLDASAICSAFGGGGHPRAAGCTMRGSIDECREKLVAEASRHMDAQC